MFRVLLVSLGLTFKRLLHSLNGLFLTLPWITAHHLTADAPGPTYGDKLCDSSSGSAARNRPATSSRVYPASPSRPANHGELVFDLTQAVEHAIQLLLAQLHMHLRLGL